MSFPKARRFDISPPKRRKNRTISDSSPNSTGQMKSSMKTSTPKKFPRVLNETFSVDEEDLYNTGLSDFFSNLDDSIETPPEDVRLNKLVAETENKLKEFYEATTFKILAQSKRKIKECVGEINKATINAFKEMEKQSLRALEILEKKFDAANQRTEAAAVLTINKEIANAKQFTRFLEEEYIIMLEKAQRKINEQVAVIDSLTERINLLELHRSIEEGIVSKRYFVDPNNSNVK